MIRSLIKLGIMAVICILIYNRFFGTVEEKATSKKIFHEMGDVARSVGGLIKTEREKFNTGKYNAALDKLSGVLQNMKKEANANNDQDLLAKVEELERKQKGLSNEMDVAETLDLENATQKAPDKLRKAKAIYDGISNLQKEIESLTTTKANE